MSPERVIQFRLSTRPVERRLLAGIGLFVGLAFGWLMLLQAGLDRPPPAADWLALAGFLALLAAMHASFVVAGFHGDETLLPTAALIAALGFLVRYRLGVPPAAEGWRGAAAAAGLTVVALALAGGRHRLLARLWLPAILAAAALAGWVLLAGVPFRGARFAPGLRTPTEALKVLLPIFLAGFLAGRREAFRRGLPGLPLPRLGSGLLFALLWGAPQICLLLQPDLGQAAIFGILLVTLLFAATGRLAYVGLGGLATLAAGGLIYRFVEHGRGRIEAWLSPFGDPVHQSWQSVQSLLALFSGGLFGHGLGMGSPAAVPVVTTDFVYAALGEELGWAGSALVLLAYLFLLRRALAIAGSQAEPAGRLLGIGLAVVLATQVLLNVGGVVKFVPITGVTLPLVSQGGSSLAVTAVMIGLLLAMSDQRLRGSAAKSRPSDRASPRDEPRDDASRRD